MGEKNNSLPLFFSLFFVTKSKFVRYFGKRHEKENRFVVFRKLSPGSATLIYLEGDTELEKLITLFIHKKQ